MKQAKNNTPDKLSPEIEALSVYLKQSGDIELAILFGSMATDSHTAKSDVDLAIKKNRPLTEHQKKELISDNLQSRFQVSLLQTKDCQLLTIIYQ